MVLFSVLRNRKKLINVLYNDLIEAKTLSTLYNDIIPSISNNFYNLELKNFCIEDSKHILSTYKNYTPTIDADTPFRQENMHSIVKDDKVSVKPVNGLPVFIFMYKTKTKKNYIWAIMSEQFHNKKRVYSDITGIIELNNNILFKMVENYLDSLISEKNIEHLMKALGVESDNNIFNIHTCLLCSIHTNTIYSDNNESINEVIDNIYNMNYKKKFYIDVYYLFLQYKSTKNIITTNPFLLSDSKYIKVVNEREYDSTKYANTVSFLIKDGILGTGYYNLKIAKLSHNRIEQEDKSKVLLLKTLSGATVKATYKTLLYNNIKKIVIVANKRISSLFILHSQETIKHNIFGSLIPPKFICSNNEIVTKISDENCSSLFLLICKINPSDISWDIVYKFAIDNKRNLFSIKDIVDCILEMKEKKVTGIDNVVNKLTNIPLGEIYERVMNKPYDSSGFDNRIVNDYRIYDLDGNLYNVNMSDKKDFYYVFQIILFLIKDY